jgi:HemY protein
MLRLIGFLVAVALVAAGLAWLADRPGELTVDWQGYVIETSVFRAIVLLFAAVVTVLAVWSLFRNVWQSPAAVGTVLAKRRQKLGIDALSSGMIALGAGDRAAAMRAAIQARKSLPNEPLTHLLRAQAAQLSGDRTTARRIFEAMLASPDTEQLGLRGLFLEAQREGETEAGRHFAERAVALNSKLAWAMDALFELQCSQSDWDGALETVAIARKNGHIDKAKADRRRAVLLTAQAQAAEESDPERTLTLALEAHALAPNLVPAAAIAGRLLASRGNTPRAAKVLQRTWSRAPHPDLATAYAFARIGDSPRDRLDRTKQLAALNPNSIESPIAVANAAIEARQYDEARSALEPLLHDRLTQRVATLMARVESEQGDKGRVREWLARAVHAPRDPAWTADGIVADRWAPISPLTRALDAFQWRVPVESDNQDAEHLASKADELAMLGVDRDIAPEPEPKPEKPVTSAADRARRRAETVEPVKEPDDDAPPPSAAAEEQEPAQERTAKPEQKHVGSQAAARTSAVPATTGARTGEAGPARRRNAGRTAPKTGKDEENGRTRVFVAPHAPDDPGPEASGQDEPVLPLRPQRA